MFSVYLFNNDNSIINNESHRCRDGTKRHDVDGDTRRIDEKDTQSQSDWNGHNHHKTGPPCTQKEDHHDNGKKQTLVNGFDDTVYAVTYKSTLIIIRFQFITGRQKRLCFFSFCHYIFGKVQQIHTRLFHKIYQHGIIPVRIYLQKLLLLLYFHTCDITQADLTYAIIAHHRIREIVYRIYSRVSKRQI